MLAGREIAPAIRLAAERELPRLDAVDERRRSIRLRVMAAFEAEGMADSDLAGSTGYGYDDAARARYESLLARILGAERALARLSIVSGTHAIVAALDALTGSGRLLCANGAPYDTLRYALVDAPQALAHRGLRYAEVPRTPVGETDLRGLADALRAEPPEVVFVQRSRGYATRRSLSIAAIASIVEVVRAQAPQAIVFVDNCYGELVEESEPSMVGADVVAGSLIKNLGGGIAPGGGYVAGRADLIERVAARIFAPGIGAGLGPMLGFGRELLQGLFYAPLVVGESLRGLDFAAGLFAQLGYQVDPLPGELRSDVVQAIRLGTPERLIAFARGLQRVLPVNARFAPEPGPVPGYVDPVIMSGGAFVSGSTIDLSCDAPLRAPYDVYLQGGVMAEHVALGAIAAAQEVYSSSGMSSPMKP